MNLFIMEKISHYSQVKQLGFIMPDDEVLFTQSLGIYYSKTPDIGFPEVPFTGEMREVDYHKHLIKHPAPYKESGEGLIRGDLGGEMRFENRDYAEIILMVDMDRRGVYGAYQIIERLGYLSHPNITFCKMVSFDEKSLTEAFNGRVPINQNVYRWVDEQRLKKTFEYWWRANSHLVFGEALKWADIKPDGAISKYQLYALCLLRDAKIPQDELFKLLEKPEVPDKYIGSKASAGSPTSYCSIIEGLVTVGLISCENGVCRLSEKGSFFIGILHPRAYDAELPFRIEQWLSAADLGESRGKMKRYINQLFGRQLRYQRKVKKTHSQNSGASFLA